MLRVKLKTEVVLTPLELRSLLDKPVQKIFDALVVSLVKHGLEEKEAQGMIAREFLRYYNDRRNYTRNDNTIG